MPLLIWKEEEGFYGWGCEDCKFVVQEPRIRESVGEYVATIRNAFDAHECEDYSQRRQTSGLLVVKKAANAH
jgi:hypothetical protein